MFKINVLNDIQNKYTFNIDPIQSIKQPEWFVYKATIQISVKGIMHGRIVSRVMWNLH